MILVLEEARTEPVTPKLSAQQEAEVMLAHALADLESVAQVSVLITMLFALCYG